MSDLESIARLICEAKGYDPDMPTGERTVQWQSFMELAETTRISWMTKASLPTPVIEGELWLRLLVMEDFLNMPWRENEPFEVRDYRHDAYRNFEPLRRAIQALSRPNVS